MSPDRTYDYLGLNVYLWERQEQNRFLISCWKPALHQLRQAVENVFAWYERFDARGPHIFAVLGTPGGELSAAADLLQAHIERFLAERQPSQALDPDALAELHADCRGKALWPADRRDGLATDRSFILQRHTGSGCPFSYWQPFDDATRWEIERLVNRSTEWALARLPADRDANVQAAVSWCADFDQHLGKHVGPSRAAEYWRHHAGTLVRGLEQRWQDDSDEVRRSLPGLIKPSSAAAFGRLWHDAESVAKDTSQSMGTMVRTIVENAPRQSVAWHAFREIHHSTLKQLGLFVRFHLPIIFFAWNRNLGETNRAEGQG